MFLHTWTFIVFAYLPHTHTHTQFDEINVCCKKPIFIALVTFFILHSAYAYTIFISTKTCYQLSYWIERIEYSNFIYIYLRFYFNEFSEMENGNRFLLFFCSFQFNPNTIRDFHLDIRFFVCLFVHWVQCQY